MADDGGRPLGIEDFIPVTGKNYIAPHILSVPTGTTYTNVHYSRAVLLIPQTPATTGIVRIYPNTYPATDASSIPVPAGNNVYLDARGDWYIRTASSATEKFLVIDAGAAGNAAAIAASFGLPPAAAAANRAAFATFQKNVAVAGTAEQFSALTVPNGFALLIKGKSGNAGSIWLGNSQANAQDHTVAREIVPGEVVSLGITDVALCWIDADVAGEGVAGLLEQ